MRKTTFLILVSAFCCAAADPVLRFSTYLGGKGIETTASTAIAADGSAWVALSTNSPDLPVPNDSAQKTLTPGTCLVPYPEGSFPGRCFDLYIAKLSSSGQVLRARYLGGSGPESPAAIRLDAAGNVWIAGSTRSADFPQARVFGTLSAFNAFVVQLNADLGTVMQSTIVAGGEPAALALDGAGGAYVAGRIFSSALPATNALQPTPSPENMNGDGFVFKLAPGGSLAYATYFGGSKENSITALAVDASGAAVLAGYTDAADLPAGGTRYGARSQMEDGFVAKIAPDGQSVTWLRYLGGTGREAVSTMTIDAGGINLGGTTTSPDFPGDDYARTDAALGRGFVTRLSADGSAVLSSRLFRFNVGAMASDGTGATWVTGNCCADSLDTGETALQAAQYGFGSDTFLVRLGETGPAQWSSYIGGTGDDRASSIAASADGVVLVGLTQSFDFAVNHALAKSLHQNPDSSPVFADGFVMRFGNTAVSGPVFRPEGITNAASYRAGEAAPGTIVTIFGDDLASVVRRASKLPLAETLGTTSVTVNGVAAPLFYISPSQINLLIPYDTAPGVATLQVRRGDKLSEPQLLRIAPASPGLFEDIRGFAAINTPSGNGPGALVHPGDWITLYATGLGALDGSLTVTLDGTPLAVTRAGHAPGFVGLDQINVVLPADFGSAIVFRNLPLAVRAGNRESNPGMITFSALRQ